MTKTIEELFETSYWIIDILPKQVPLNSDGQYFAIEKYFLDKSRITAIKEKHIDLVLKLNCYRNISLDDEQELNPSPQTVAEEMLRRHLCIRVDDSLIVSEPDETYMTVFEPDEELLELIRRIAAGEGLYVWQPEEY